MLSDHFPVWASFILNVSKFTNEPCNKLNYLKANWDLFKNILNSISSSHIQTDQDLSAFTNNIINAANIAIPKFPTIKFRTTLPKKIIEIIKIRRKARRNWKKYRSHNFKAEFNKTTNILRNELKIHKNNYWKEFAKNLGQNISSKPFWIKINKFRQNRSYNSSIPTLTYNNHTYETTDEKINLFSQILESTFTINSSQIESNSDHTIYNTVNTYFSKKANINSESISIEEVIKAIKETKNDSAVGFDLIHNRMLKNLPKNAILLITSLFNYCLDNNFLPKSWKTSKITLIPKKDTNKSDPNNYRPISVSSCLGKILERIITKRLTAFLERNNLLLEFQSGFRKHRRTSDNLLFITQKIIESFNRKKKTCAIFFDISKAFDKVWHDGLLFKLIKLNTPDYIIRYIYSFLDNRSFRIFLNNQYGPEFPIKAGTPQGSVISPILFNIYINDIPNNSSKNKSQPLLFADDLTSLFFFNKESRIRPQILKFIKELESWLVKWKMKISTNKCSYIIFSKGGASNITLPLMGSNIPRTSFTTFLGITLDEKLTFRKHIEITTSKCYDRLKIIKVLAHKSWKLNQNVLGYIYKTLIGSLIDYSFLLVNIINQNDFHRLQVVQNRATRIIFQLPYDCTNELLMSFETKLNMIRLNSRLLNLLHKFVAKAIISSNPLVLNLIQEFNNGFTARHSKYPTPLCSCLNLIRINLTF